MIRKVPTVCICNNSILCVPVSLRACSQLVNKRAGNTRSWRIAVPCTAVHSLCTWHSCFFFFFVFVRLYTGCEGKPLGSAPRGSVLFLILSSVASIFVFVWSWRCSQSFLICAIASTSPSSHGISWHMVIALKLLRWFHQELVRSVRSGKPSDAAPARRTDWQLKNAMHTKAIFFESTLGPSVLAIGNHIRNAYTVVLVRW